MATNAPKPDGHTRRRQMREQDVDRHVGARIRERRLMLGLTQQELAEAMEITYQQAHKYETGINRISAGRLYAAAQALGVEVSYFFEGLNSENEFEPTSQQRQLLGLVRNFLSLPSRQHQETISELAKMLADGKDVS